MMGLDHAWTRGLMALALPVLTACQSLAPTPEPTSGRPASASPVTPASAPIAGASDPATVQPADLAWRHAGRLSLTVTSKGQGAEGLDKVERVPLSFDGEGDGTAGRLDLSSQLGTVVARLQWDAQSATLETSQGVNRYASLEAMCAQLFGEPLPLKSVLQWMKGRPDPSLPVEWLGGEAGTFRQLGWMVRLDRWAEGLLQAERDQGRLIQLKVKLDTPPNR